MLEFYSSTVGKKIIVAGTGIILFGFVVLHMLGNLKAFMGFDPQSGFHHLDLYAAFLREVGQEVVGRTTVLWLTRLVLLAALIVHVVTVYQLRRINAQARPVPYARVKYEAANVASRTLWWGGLFILLFVVLHILHLTTGQLHFQGFAEGKVYANVYNTFQVWYVAAFYVLAMALLGLHIFHGAWSLFQTLGLDDPGRNFVLRMFARVMAVILFVGFISVPLAMLGSLMPAPRAVVATSHY